MLYGLRATSQHRLWCCGTCEQRFHRYPDVVEFIQYGITGSRDKTGAERPELRHTASGVTRKNLSGQQKIS